MLRWHTNTQTKHWYNKWSVEVISEGDRGKLTKQQQQQNCGKSKALLKVFLFGWIENIFLKSEQTFKKNWQNIQSKVLVKDALFAELIIN